MNPRRLATLLAHPRGYVLIIVLIIGVAAGAGALALMNTADNSRISATTSELGDRSHAFAEAGMQRAVHYLNDVVGNYGDFDAALDTDLNNTNCSAPEDDDLRPDTTLDGDDITEWDDDGYLEEIDGLNYTCVKIREPWPGGRYCVHFEDDDDDAIVNEDWWETTGNHEKVGSPISDSKHPDIDYCHKSSPAECREGPANETTYCYKNASCKAPPAATHSHEHHNNGKNNRLRDRNRTIWVTSIGVYPLLGVNGDEVPLSGAKYKTTLRRLHTAPQLPTRAGLQIRGNVDLGGNTNMYACSDVAAVAIDGTVTIGGSASMCASGYSRADDWGDATQCEDDDCDDISFGGGTLNIVPLSGNLEKPGPTVPAMPKLWENAAEHIDFSRECVFWLEGDHDDCDDDGDGSEDTECSIVSKRNLPTTGSVKTGLDAPSLWWWDANEPRGPAGAPCEDYETANPKGAMPGPPNPAAAHNGADACTSATNPDCWAGCWSPLILNMNGTTAAQAVTDESGAKWATGQCWSAPFHTSTSTVSDSALIGVETGVVDGECAWFPSANSGNYTVGGASCATTGKYGHYTTHGHDSSSDPDHHCSGAGCGTNYGCVGATCAEGSGTLNDPLNYKLSELGMSSFPSHARLSKPNWATACTISYPMKEIELDGTTITPTNYTCSGSCTGPGTGGSPVRFVEDKVFPMFDSKTDIKSAPPGVYILSGGSTGGSGSALDWGANAATGVTAPAPWSHFNEWPKMTIYAPGELELQREGYTFGIGQRCASPSTPGEQCSSLWGSYPSLIGTSMSLKGGGEAGVAGSLYAYNGGGWSSSSAEGYFVFGLLFSNSAFEGNGGKVYWIYRVELGEGGADTYAGGNASQSIISQ